MEILEEINSLVKQAAAMPPQNPVVPGIGAPPPAGRTVPPISPPEVKTPALPVPPPHKSELPVAGASKKVDWLKAWMAKNRANNIQSLISNNNNNPSQLGRRSPVNRLNGSYR